MSNFTISLEQAIIWARSWRNNPPKALAKGHLIPGAALQELLATENVVNVRAYMGVDETNTQKLMFVGVDSAGHDMIGENNSIYDHTEPCPKICDPSSPLFTP